MNRWKYRLLAIALVQVLFGSIAYAQSSSSSNFRVDEYFIGPGGENDINSTNYNARATLGDAGVGNSASGNYQLYGGFTTTNEPHLELTVTAAIVDFGELDSTITGSGNATFSVRSYLNSGYSITTSGAGLENGNGDLIAPLASAAVSTVGTEQFGINLVSNSLPSAFGTNPVQVPGVDFSFGAAAVGYNSSNTYKYVDGDVIATSDQSSGQTDYTISYIVNVGPNTPSGLYTMKHFVVATPTF